MLKNIANNAQFEYKTVKKEDLELVYDNNILKIKLKDGH